MGNDTEKSEDNVQLANGLSAEKKAELLYDLRQLNKRISRKQRANLYEPLKDYLTKPIFNQIVRGLFVSVNNVRVAQLLKTKMEDIVAKNETILNS